jgi:hypothetical protein
MAAAPLYYRAESNENPKKLGLKAYNTIFRLYWHFHQQATCPRG